MAHKGAVYLLKHRAPVKMAEMVFLICLAWDGMQQGLWE